MRTRCRYAAALAPLVLTLGACGGGQPTATTTVTVTATSSPAATTTAPSATSATAPTAETTSAEATTAAGASTAAATASTSGPAGMDELSDEELAAEAGAQSLEPLADGQTGSFGAGIYVTAKWGDFDPDVSTGDGPHDKGCTWVRFTAENRSKYDFMASNPAIDGNAAEPYMSTTMEAGDELRDVSGVMMTGKRESGEWPHRLRAGKTSTWEECFQADEQEQHIELAANPGGTKSSPLLRWVRK